MSFYYYKQYCFAQVFWMQLVTLMRFQIMNMKSCLITKKTHYDGEHLYDGVHIKKKHHLRGTSLLNFIWKEPLKINKNILFWNSLYKGELTSGKETAGWQNSINCRTPIQKFLEIHELCKIITLCFDVLYEGLQPVNIVGLVWANIYSVEI